MTVAKRTYQYPLTCLVGSTPTAPLSVIIALPDIVMSEVAVRVPPGPLGQVGFYVTQAGTPIVPFGLPATFLIFNDEYQRFPVNTEIANGIGVTYYNMGQWPHTLYFRFTGTPVSLQGPGVPIVTIVPIT